MACHCLALGTCHDAASVNETDRRYDELGGMIMNYREDMVIPEGWSGDLKANIRNLFDEVPDTEEYRQGILRILNQEFNETVAGEQLDGLHLCGVFGPGQSLPEHMFIGCQNAFNADTFPENSIRRTLPDNGPNGPNCPNGLNGPNGPIAIWPPSEPGLNKGRSVVTIRINRITQNQKNSLQNGVGGAADWVAF